MISIAYLERCYLGQSEPGTLKDGRDIYEHCHLLYRPDQHPSMWTGTFPSAYTSLQATNNMNA